MRKLMKSVAEEAVVDLNAVKYDVQPGQAIPTVVPRLSSLPVLIWKAEIGCQAWKNNAVPVGNDVLVASSGRIWNEHDDMDGIHCLHAETGKTRWFFNTPADANRLMVSKGLVLAGCDDGSVVAVALHDGTRQWCTQLDSAVVGGPLRLPANVADGLAVRQNNTVEPILVVTWQGNLHILDQVTGRIVGSHSLGTSVIGTPALLPGGAGVVVPSCDGRVHLIGYSDIDIAFENARELAIAPHDLGEDASATVELAAQPCLAGSLILQGLVRDTYYDDPPLVAIDSRSMSLQWVARAPPDPGGFGNLRGAPVIVGQEAILAPAYAAGLCAVSLQTGQMSWSLDLSQQMFEQWSAPVAMGRSILIGRHDGYLHKVSCERRRREWSMYLGEHGQAGAALPGSQAPPEFSDSSAWAAGSSSPILATPTLDRGRLYVGTHEGWLYCISNLGGDDPDF
jgi:outer membrane protein assembly factor BamB